MDCMDIYNTIVGTISLGVRVFSIKLSLTFSILGFNASKNAIVINSVLLQSCQLSLRTNELEEKEIANMSN